MILNENAGKTYEPGRMGIAEGMGMVFTVNIPVPALVAVPIVSYSVGRYHRLAAALAVGAVGLLLAVAVGLGVNAAGGFYTSWRDLWATVVAVYV